MSLKPGINLQAFMRAVRQCSGDVLFETEEGDRLNLKSALSQFVFASAFFIKLQNIKSTVVCNAKDFQKLIPFLE